MKHEKRKPPKKDKPIKKVPNKKSEKIMDFNYIVPEEQMEATIDLFCFGGNYKEYIPDVDNPGEMIPNIVSKETFAQDQMTTVLDQYLLGKNRRKKEERLNKAVNEAPSVEDVFDEYLKDKKSK